MLVNKLLYCGESLKSTWKSECSPFGVTVVLFCFNIFRNFSTIMAAQLDLPLPEITVEDFK